jgi:aspartate kinase
MHSRSIEFAKKFGVKVVVRSSFKDIPGTLIHAADQSVKRPVSGVALAKDEARITLEGTPDQPGSSHALFSMLAESGIAVDMIVQNVGQGGRADISFTVPEDDLADALEWTERVAKAIKAEEVSHDHRMAKVSVVGVGMEDAEGVAGRMFSALSAEKINVHMITTSEIKISVLVARTDGPAAVKAVHKAFGLLGSACEMDDKVLAQRLAMSRGTLGNYLTGRTAKVKCDFTQARVLMSAIDVRVAKLREAADIFAKVRP